MKKTLASLLLVLGSSSYASYVIQLPLETQKGGALPTNSVIFNIADSETPTDPETPSYENTGGSFGTGSSSNSIITAETTAVYVDRTTVSYTLTTTHKLILDSVSVEDASGNAASYSNVNITYQNCSGSGPYTCIVHISGTENSGLMDPYNGLGEINNEFGILLDVTFNGRYQTN